MSSNGSTPGLLCLAHLGWDNVWQRPQHILSRLARHYPVHYVNEPRIEPRTDGQPRLELVAEEGQLCAWQPILPDRPEVVNAYREVYTRLIQDELVVSGWLQPGPDGPVARRPLIAWFYTPMPYYVLDHIAADVVVYDVMDELGNFKNAPPDLREREARLLGQADIVLTGGRSLYEARLGRHRNLHLFTSGVEIEHFAAAQHPETELAPEIADLPRPVLGYYGVVDERLDLELLDAVAAEHPEWSIVIVGPVTKIRPEDLPRRPNLIYVGKQPYERLPGLLKGFDVCLMPFAMNDATRYISPTKTLEYMAAHKPIVSTLVADVVRNWSDVVFVAAGPASFARAVEQALAEDEISRTRRLALEQEIVAVSSWDEITREVHGLIETVLHGDPVELQMQAG